MKLPAAVVAVVLLLVAVVLVAQSPDPDAGPPAQTEPEGEAEATGVLFEQTRIDRTGVLLRIENNHTENVTALVRIWDAEIEPGEDWFAAATMLDANGRLSGSASGSPEFNVPLVSAYVAGQRLDSPTAPDLVPGMPTVWDVLYQGEWVNPIRIAPGLNHLLLYLQKFSGLVEVTADRDDHAGLDVQLIGESPHMQQWLLSLIPGDFERELDARVVTFGYIAGSTRVTFHNDTNKYVLVALGANHMKLTARHENGLACELEIVNVTGGLIYGKFFPPGEVEFRFEVLHGRGGVVSLSVHDVPIEAPKDYWVWCNDPVERSA